MQKPLLNGLKELIPPNQSANKWLAQLLGVDEATASRKFSGKTILKPEHIEKIVAHYPNLLHTLVPKKLQKEVLIGNYSYFSKPKDIETYLLKVKGVLELALSKNLKLHYFARDLPLFFFLALPAIFRFKIAMWCNTVSIENTAKAYPGLEALAETVFQLYQQVPTEEIWYKNLINNQLFQLDFYTSCGKMTPHKKKEILEAMRHVFYKARDWAIDGKKDTGSYNLSISDYALLNNGGLLKSKNQTLMLMTSLSSVFFVSTQHPQTLKSFNAEYAFHKERAISLANNNERNRYTFFKDIDNSLTNHSLITDPPA